MIVYLSMSIIVLILGYWFYKLLNSTLLSTFRRYRYHQYIYEKGKEIRAKIIDKKQHKENAIGQLITIIVEFNNFVGTPITESFRFTDTKPFQNRYEVGKSISVLIDRDSPNESKVQLVGGKAVLSPVVISIITAILGAYAYGCYWFFMKSWAMAEQDWDKFFQLFQDSEVSSLSLAYAGVLTFMWLLFKGIGIGFVNNTKDTQLKYWGYKATGFVNKYERTGMTVNDNPQVRFHFSFTDSHGQTHQASDTKLIDMLDIGLIPTMKEMEVIYSADNPTAARLVANLNGNNGMGGAIVEGVFYLVAFIFSAVVVGMAVAQVL